MLTTLVPESWKSFGSSEPTRRTVRLSPVTLLVGPNGSGKSNVLDALRFLQGAARTMVLSDVLRGAKAWSPIRGHLAEAARRGTSRFSIASTWALGQQVTTHRINVSIGKDALIEREELVDARGQRLAALSRPGSGLSLLGGSDADVAEIKSALSSSVFLDVRPEAMRDYRPEGSELGTSGENISPVLSRFSADLLQDVVDWLSELCAPAVEAIDFDRTKLGEVMMFVVERGGERVSARSMSDGTLRFLGLIVALLTCEEGSLVVIEEPDVGLHPSRIRLLAELFEDVAARRKVQVLATTHSPGLLAHLSAEALGAVVAFARDPVSGETVCSELRSLAHFETLRDAEHLDHLISTGWLERAL